MWHHRYGNAYSNRYMKLGINNIIGKKIASVVVTEKIGRTPRLQAYLVFSDDTYLEFYGDYFECTNGLCDGGVDDIVRFSERNGIEEIKVIGRK